MRLNVSLRFSPGNDIPVGVLMEVGRDVAFEYDARFIAMGLDLSPFRLPVKSGVQVFDRAGGMEAFGLFEDSLPDGWGRRLIDVEFKRRQGRFPTVLERLSVVGCRGMGALVYEPEMETSLAYGHFDLATLADSAMDFDAGRIEDVLPEVRKAGGSSGGARPKALVGFNPQTGTVCPEGDDLPPGFEHWLVKFNVRSEGDCAAEREFAYYRKAVCAGVNMMPSRLIRTAAGTFFATKRFDRTASGGRLHLASVAGLLHANFRIPGDEYSVLFKVCESLTRDHAAKCELFRRVCLNVCGHNRDDHLKNFSFLMDANGTWSLAPFYDFTYAEGPNGWHTLSVAGEGMNPSDRDLLRLAKEVDLPEPEAREIMTHVRSVWEAREA